MPELTLLLTYGIESSGLLIYFENENFGDGLLLCSRGYETFPFIFAVSYHLQFGKIQQHSTDKCF